MHSRITTTITTLIDLETFEPTHSVSVEAEDELPVAVIKAAVVGACKSAAAAAGTAEPDPDEVDQA